MSRTESTRSAVASLRGSALTGHSQPVTDIAWSPDGRMLASAATDGTVRLWNPATRQAVHTLSGHTAPVTSIAFSPDGALLASAGEDDTVRCWDLATGLESRRFYGPSAFRSVAWSPDQQRVCAVQTKRVHIFHLGLGKIEDILFEHARLARRALWLPDGTIASAGDDGQMRLWDVVTGRPFAVHDVGSGVRDLAHCARAHTLAAGCSDGSIRIWQIEPWSERPPLRGAAGRVTRLSFSGDSTYLAACDPEGQVELHATTSLQSVRLVELPLARCMVFHPLRPLLALAVGTDVQFADIETVAVAEAAGRAPATAQRERTLFVSYSKKDQRWLKKLQVHVQPLVRDGVLDLWDDTRVEYGADWRLEIEAALSRASAAVLLISAHFQASDFIARHELPRLLQRAASGGLRILPLIVSPVLPDEAWSKYQSVNPPNRPLSKMSSVEVDEVLVRLAAFLSQQVKGQRV